MHKQSLKSQKNWYLVVVVFVLYHYFCRSCSTATTTPPFIPLVPQLLFLHPQLLPPPSFIPLVLQNLFLQPQLLPPPPFIPIVLQNLFLQPQLLPPLVRIGLISKVTKTTSNNQEVYIGLTENEFKTRFNLHKSSFKLEHKRTLTSHSDHVWKLKNKNINFNIKWEVVKK